MGTLDNVQSPWSEVELEQQEGNFDEETETCIGVRGVLSHSNQSIRVNERFTDL
jgi:hypothetical protein